MSTTALGLSDERAASFYGTTVGKKVVMAASGVILFLFIIGHMVGNLQFFEGPEKLNAYARFLRVEPAILWGVRLTLLIMVGLHIWSSIQLALVKSHARPIKYVKKKSIVSTYASRTMYWSGPIIAAFVIYHLLDLTVGVANPGYQEGEVYANMVRSFQQPLVSGFYLFAMALLCTHLFHGAWSMFQTLGMNSPRYTPLLRRFAAIISVVIFLGFAAIPVSVITGLMK